MESIALLFGRELLLGKRTLASDAQRMYDAVLQICQNESRQEEVSRESALTVLYDCLLLASNAFTMPAQENTVILHTLQIDVPCIFTEIEKRLCPKGRLAEQYRQVRDLSRGKTEIPKQAMQVITAYHAFAYMRLASGLVSGCLKGWGLL